MWVSCEVVWHVGTIEKEDGMRLSAYNLLHRLQQCSLISLGGHNIGEIHNLWCIRALECRRFIGYLLAKVDISPK